MLTVMPTSGVVGGERGAISSALNLAGSADHVGQPSSVRMARTELHVRGQGTSASGCCTPSVTPRSGCCCGGVTQAGLRPLSEPLAWENISQARGAKVDVTPSRREGARGDPDADRDP